MYGMYRICFNFITSRQLVVGFVAGIRKCWALVSSFSFLPQLIVLGGYFGPLVSLLENPILKPLL